MQFALSTEEVILILERMSHVYTILLQDGVKGQDEVTLPVLAALQAKSDYAGAYPAREE